jgi:uncharacterized protein (DUF952 family)
MIFHLGAKTKENTASNEGNFVMNSQKDQVVATIKEELKGSSDLVLQQLDAKEKKCEFYYISSICKQEYPRNNDRNNNSRALNMI